MIIGIVGGMGSVATVDFFSRVIAAFPAEKEWDRPRIILDNRCDMPSRVRGILYNEKVNEIVNSLTESIQMMIEHGCDMIVLVCNTSHYYLDLIYKTHPEFKSKIIHIIDSLADEMNKKNVKSGCLLASEGTYLSKIYDKSFEKYGITYTKGVEEARVREWIESVKTYTITSEIKDDFIHYINEECNEQNIILGCTELPVLYKECKNRINKNIFDPLESVISKLTLT